MYPPAGPLRVSIGLAFFIAYRGADDLKKLKKDLDAEIDRMGGIDHISREKLIQQFGEYRGISTTAIRRYSETVSTMNSL